MESPEGWSAWHDHMPGPNSNPTLHVTGSLKVNTGGYSARLEKHEPQDAGENALVLDLVVEGPADGDVVTQALTKVPVEYVENTETEYRSVVINSRFVLPVQEVS